MSEESFNLGNVVICKSSDNKQVWLEKPRRTKPVNVKAEDLSAFAKMFINAIQKNFPNTVKDEEKDDIIEDFKAFLSGTKAEEITLEIAEEEKLPTPVMKPVAVPLTHFAEKEEAKEEKKEVKEEEKAIDLNELVDRFRELQSQYEDVDEIYEILSNETGIAKETIVRMLPIPKEEISKERVKPTVVEQPKPVAVEIEEKEFDITKLPGYSFLRPQHIEWLKTLAKIYNCSVESLVKRLVDESKKFKIQSDTVWITLLFNEARSHNLIQLVKERVMHLIFGIVKNGERKTINCIVSRNIEKELNITLDVDRCYKIPELDIIGRLIARSIPPYRDISSYPEEYQKMRITKLEPTGDMPIIPYAHEWIKPLTLKQAIENAKMSPNKEIEDAIYGTVTNFNEWSSGNGAFLVVHDGDMDVPLNTNKIVLSYDNPFGIDEKTVHDIIDKLVLVYGYIRYVEPRGNFPEGLTISPMYLRVVS